MANFQDCSESLFQLFHTWGCRTAPYTKWSVPHTGCKRLFVVLSLKPLNFTYKSEISSSRRYWRSLLREISSVDFELDNEPLSQHWGIHNLHSFLSTPVHSTVTVKSQKSKVHSTVTVKSQKSKVSSSYSILYSVHSTVYIILYSLLYAVESVRNTKVAMLKLKAEEVWSLKCSISLHWSRQSTRSKLLVFIDWKALDWFGRLEWFKLLPLDQKWERFEVRGYSAWCCDGVSRSCVFDFQPRRDKSPEQRLQFIWPPCICRRNIEKKLRRLWSDHFGWMEPWMHRTKGLWSVAGIEIMDNGPGCDNI